METPQNRVEFERNIHILAEALRNGKFHINDKHSIESIAKIRNLHNGRIDFLTVNESARLNANTQAHMQQFESYFPKEINDIDD